MNESLDPAMLLKTFAPRPLAWVSSINEDRSINVAPFSAFMLVSNRPPVILLTVQRNADGARKRTARNILDRHRFVLNFPRHEQLVAWMPATSPDVANDRRATVSGIEYEEGSRGPRISGCLRYAECRLASAQTFVGDGADLFFAEICAVTESDDHDPHQFVGALGYEWFVSDRGLSNIEQPYLSTDAAGPT